MGTRSLTIVKDEQGKELVTIYCQYDGYPEGMGADLAEILKGRAIVNGILGGADLQKISNGMGCLAATIIKKLKKEAGGVYIYPQGTRDCGEEYIYTISNESGTLKMLCEDAYEKRALFEGTPEEFLNWLPGYKEEESE